MASPFDGIDSTTVQILGLVYSKGRRGKGKGMGGDGRGGWKGRIGRGVDTVERWRHLLGVNRNYNIYIIPI